MQHVRSLHWWTKFTHTDSLCFLEFLSYYYGQSKTARVENGCQPVLLNDELIEANHADNQFAQIIHSCLQRKVQVEESESSFAIPGTQYW